VLRERRGECCLRTAGIWGGGRRKKNVRERRARSMLLNSLNHEDRNNLGMYVEYQPERWQFGTSVDLQRTGLHPDSRCTSSCLNTRGRCLFYPSSAATVDASHVCCRVQYVLASSFVAHGHVISGSNRKRMVRIGSEERVHYPVKIRTARAIALGYKLSQL